MRIMDSLKKGFLAVALVSVAAPGSVLAESDAAAAPKEIVVENGYHPSTVVVKPGIPIKLTFVRREHAGCTREVVFPTLGIRRDLPTNVPVVIELPALEPGEVQFHCGMKMIRGVIKVEAEG